MAKKKVSKRRVSPARVARSTRNTQGPRLKSEPKAARKGRRPKPTAKPEAAKATEPAAIELIARGVLIAGSRVLLCRNLKHDYLYLPGGHVEFGESAAAALAREFLEEAALPVRVGALALVSEGTFATKRRGHHEVNLVFHVEQTGARRASADVKSQEAGLGLEWLDFGAIPESDIRPEAAKAFLLTLGTQPPGTIEFVSEIPAR